MANYLYKTKIFKSTNGVLGVDVAQNNADKTDFETNFKSSAEKVDGVIFAETTFIIEKTYTQFKALIDGVIIVWGDVKYRDDGTYELNLLSGSLL